MLKVDLHLHTNYVQPYEGNYSPKVLIDEMVKQGFDAIAITEHSITNPPDWFIQTKDDVLSPYKDFKSYADKKGILLLPGVERMIEGKEVLLINFNGNPNTINTFEDLEKLPKTVAIIPSHPFFIKKQCIGKLLETHIHKFDAVEYSHFYTWWINRNKKAVKIAKKYGKPMIGTSDAHRLFQIGHTYTLVDSEKKPESIIKAIKEGKVKLVTKPIPTKFFFNLIKKVIVCKSYLLKKKLKQLF